MLKNDFFDICVVVNDGVFENGIVNIDVGIYCYVWFNDIIGNLVVFIDIYWVDDDGII